MEKAFIIAALIFAAYQWGASTRPVVSPQTFTIKVLVNPIPMKETIRV